MDRQTLASWSMVLLVSALSAPGALRGATIAETYSFTGSAHNLVIANGFLTADGVATGSLNGMNGVGFDTHNHIDLTTMQNFGTFTFILPDGDTAFGTLFEDDANVSLITSSGPFLQTLTVTGGFGVFAGASGVLTGGGFIYPTFYTTSGAGTLTGPNLAATPEPGSAALLLFGLAAAAIGLKRRSQSCGRLGCQTRPKLAHRAQFSRMRPPGAV